jgi:hypothetical protein
VEVGYWAHARRRGGEALRLVRERDARPVLIQLHAYLLVIREQVLPKGDAGQAIAYALKNWTELARYCADGDLSIDNNGTERSLRGFAIRAQQLDFLRQRQRRQDGSGSAQLYHIVRTGQDRSVRLVQRCSRADRRPSCQPA